MNGVSVHIKRWCLLALMRAAAAASFYCLALSWFHLLFCVPAWAEPEDNRAGRFLPQTHPGFDWLLQAAMESNCTAAFLGPHLGFDDHSTDRWFFFLISLLACLVYRRRSCSLPSLPQPHAFASPCVWLCVMPSCFPLPLWVLLPAIGQAAPPGRPPSRLVWPLEQGKR